MSHYEQRLQRDLDAIRAQVQRVGTKVEQAVRDSVRALVTRNFELATETILGDIAINELTRELDRLCHGFVARHLPSARHLRFVSAVLRMSIALERIGDYAETISRSTLRLSQDPPETFCRDMEVLGEQAEQVLRAALGAFAELNGDQARTTMKMVGQFGATIDRVFDDLRDLGERGERSFADLLVLMSTCHRLDRVIHQSKNLCEHTVFIATGETKGPKRFHILFLDRDNSGASQIAERVARKAYPEAGTYRSAGMVAAPAVHPEFLRYADEHGIDLQDVKPRNLADVGPISEFQIIIGLEKGLRDELGPLSFHTVLLLWPLSRPEDPAAVHAELVELLSALVSKIRGISD